MHWLIECWTFGLKQAYACLFGGFLLLIMLVTHFWYPLDTLHRYDFIFIAAIVAQIVLLATGLETWRESVVILVFHWVATVMELFKTSDAIGSWVYPEPAFFQIANVPLFTGFMYSAVGSYIARIWRIFDFRFSHYPPTWTTVILVVFIYLNFFTHHYWWDMRWLLVGLTGWLFYRSVIFFKVYETYRRMPLLVGWLLVALFIWLAENLATYANIWIYPNQSDQWQLVSLSKLSSWYLLMLLSFVLVSLINRVESHPSHNGVRNLVD
ncbi:hypothetical protein BGP77_04265 [Saccharospirillum sp. MSK14-1]|uniref:DUF817 domain-containing protein n=1 Tax=Saccharospirillum sp. MSK14-1 TaxID=1897632 RepID=UPI000D3470D7|nr:DUF817 domain-containing protein [Saccharospirillum sp. MSK14-1]PTY36518.1 hypothetical protein BGP77_04265 [Saccharospirillum sp. MSK14-1]